MLDNENNYHDDRQSITGDKLSTDKAITDQFKIPTLAIRY